MAPLELTRREFTRALGLGLAPMLSGLAPAISALAPPVAARGREERLGLGGRVLRVKRKPKDPADLILLNSNENPYGPSPAALEAMVAAHEVACRYPDYWAYELQERLAAFHGVSQEMVEVTCGSTEVLKVAAQAFAGPGRRLVLADPTFEAIAHYAETAGGEVIKVPLDAHYRHDLDAMAAAARAQPGLLYLCNPNNPTGTVVSHQAVAQLLAQVPAETVVLVDEAYHHYVESPDYASALDSVLAGHPGVIVSRTFSKIYGMAGLRLGYALAHEELIEKMRPHQVLESWNVMACVAALASLEDTELVPRGRARNKQARDYVRGEMKRRGYSTLPSETNFMMIDLGQEVTPVIEAFREQGIAVGRLFPSLPQHLRLSIGKPEEMEKFVEAFDQILPAPRFSAGPAVRAA
ncbi:MAG: histidinol-phosphate transaminase [Terriglobia bacterium]